MSTSTDDNGHYEFQDVPPGSYRLSVEGRWQYEPASANVDAMEGSSAVVDFALVRRIPAPSVEILEPTGTVGGTADLYVKLTFQDMLSEPLSLVIDRLEQTDIHPVEWVDVWRDEQFDLWNYEWFILDEWWPEGTDDHVVILALWWNTTDCHNGPHRLRARAVFCNPWGDPLEERDEQQPTVSNLVITGVSTSNGTVDYLKYDPDGPPELQRPSVSFSISDGDPEASQRWYQCVVYLRATGHGDFSTSDPYMTATVKGPQSLTLTWDGAQTPGGQPDTMPWGTYTFDVYVRKFYDDPGDNPDYGDMMDEQAYKTPYALWIPDTVEVDGQTVPGHNVWFHVDDQGKEELRANYQLHSQAQTDAEDMVLTPIDNELSEKDSVSGSGAIDVFHNGANPDGIYGTDDDGIVTYTLTDSNAAGTWRDVFTTTDPSGAPDRRDHMKPRMLAQNKTGTIVPADTVAGRGDSGLYFGQAKSFTMQWQQKATGKSSFLVRSCEAKRDDILKRLPKTAVFTYWGHGQASILDLDQKGEIVSLTDLYGVGGAIDMKKCLLAVWGCCHSADGTTKTDNWVDQSVKINGADCALGWTDFVKASAFKVFADVFWKQLCLYGAAVSSAANEAVKKTIETLKLPIYYAGIESWRTAGNPGLSVVPPRWGEP